MGKQQQRKQYPHKTGLKNGQNMGKQISAKAMRQGLQAIENKDYPAAFKHFKALHQQYPHHADAQYFYGVMAFHTQQADEAITALQAQTGWQKVAKSDSDGNDEASSKPYATVPTGNALYHTHEDALYFLGLAYHEAGEFKEACRVLEALIASPALPVEYRKKTHAMLGRSLMSAYESAKAVEHLNKALAIDPNCGVTWTNLAHATMAMDKLDDAAEAHETAIRLNENNTAQVQAVLRLKRSLAMLYKRLGREAECQQLYQQIFNATPSYGLILEQSLFLPNIYPSLTSVGNYRNQFIGNLAAMVQDAPLMPHIAEELNCPPAFLLAYHGENDREIHSALGQLFHRSLNPPELPKKPRGQKIKVGVISRFMVEKHTIGKLYLGLFKHLNPDDFDVYIFQIAPKFHPKAHGGWVKDGNITRGFLPETNQALAQKIVAHAGLDVAFFTDIGMDPTTYFLAFNRLAPVQCVTFGHPVTTGIPNMDYFISARHMEPDGADDHYSEQLVCLENIPTYYAKPKVTQTFTKADYGFTEDDHLYICPQSLFKMHPEYDAIFKGILEKDPKANIVLLEGVTKIWDDQLVARYQQSLGAEHTQRIRFLSRMPREKLIGLMQCAEVMLDPIHFGGGNTSLEAFAVGTPIVTWPGGYMRSRVTSAAYHAMQVTELIVPTHAAYIDKAVEIATNPAVREQYKQSILAASDILFENETVVRELETFFRLAVDEAEKQGRYLPTDECIAF